MQDVSSAKSLLQQAVSHHRAGALAQAESRYRQVLALDERQPDATHNLGAVLAQQGKLSDALPFLLRALDLEAGRPKYWSVCIDTLVAAGRLDRAVEVYRRLIALQPRLAAQASRNSRLSCASVFPLHLRSRPPNMSAMRSATESA